LALVKLVFIEFFVTNTVKLVHFGSGVLVKSDDFKLGEVGFDERFHGINLVGVELKRGKFWGMEECQRLKRCDILMGQVQDC
jgi:hypothetical protein